MATSKPRSLAIQAHLDAAGSASGGGDYERVAFFRLANFHTEKRGKAVDAEHPEERGVRNERDLGDFLK